MLVQKQYGKGEAFFGTRVSVDIGWSPGHRLCPVVWRVRCSFHCILECNLRPCVHISNKTTAACSCPDFRPRHGPNLGQAAWWPAAAHPRSCVTYFVPRFVRASFEAIATATDRAVPVRPLRCPAVSCLIQLSCLSMAELERCDRALPQPP